MSPLLYSSLVRELTRATSEIEISDIGEGDDALLCMTDSTDCCTAETTLAGKFYYPDGSVVGVRASGDSLYRSRGDQLIRLNRRNGATSPLGRYRCAIPDSTGATTNVYINIVAGACIDLVIYYLHSLIKVRHLQFQYPVLLSPRQPTEELQAQQISEEELATPVTLATL